MKTRISRDDLVQRPLMVATPMYGGQCCGNYVHALLGLNSVMVQHGLVMKYFSVANESLVTRARNFCTHVFLNRTECTHLMFIDADIEFRPDDVISFLDIADPNSDKDVVCGLYPKKHINWDKVSHHVLKGTYGEALAAKSTDLNFNPLGLEPGTFPLGEPMEVTECATGFMMVQRHVFEKFALAHPTLHYKSDGREQKGLGEGNILACFETAIIDGRYLTEDYNFCRMVRQLGMKVWVAPWVELSHLGHYKFVGNALAMSEPVKELN
jgi:hypothetical protein